MNKTLSWRQAEHISLGTTASAFRRTSKEIAGAQTSPLSEIRRGTATKSNPDNPPADDISSVESRAPETNAAAPQLNPRECTQFLTFWLEVTEMPCVTLVSIVPDGATVAKTFMRRDLDAAAVWVATQQKNGRNVYFQPNETQSGCVRKPRKTDMVAVVCRFADIDPVDERYSLAEERDRLRRLAEHQSLSIDRLPDSNHRFRQRLTVAVGSHPRTAYGRGH